jgi:hypothetical protein
VSFPVRTAVSRARDRRPLVLVAVAAIAVVIVAVGAFVLLGGSGASRAATSGASGCQDEKRAGLVPTLEHRVPGSFEGRAADQLDSSVTCTADGLGSLGAVHGLTSVSSAGGLWDLGPSTGITLAVFRVDGAARADWVAEFYETGALSARKVTGLTETHPTVAGRAATRLDYADASFPGTIVVWPGRDPDLVNVVLAAGVPDRIIEEGIAAFADG